jgi:hypothetical protein
MAKIQRWPLNENVMSRGLRKLQREILHGIGTERHDMREVSKLLPAGAKEDCWRAAFSRAIGSLEKTPLGTYPGQ